MLQIALFYYSSHSRAHHSSEEKGMDGKTTRESLEYILLRDTYYPRLDTWKSTSQDRLCALVWAIIMTQIWQIERFNQYRKRSRLFPHLSIGNVDQYIANEYHRINYDRTRSQKAQVFPSKNLTDPLDHLNSIVSKYGKLHQKLRELKNQDMARLKLMDSISKEISSILRSTANASIRDQTLAALSTVLDQNSTSSGYVGGDETGMRAAMGERDDRSHKAEEDQIFNNSKASASILNEEAKQHRLFEWIHIYHFFRSNFSYFGILDVLIRQCFEAWIVRQSFGIGY